MMWLIASSIYVFRSEQEWVAPALSSGRPINLDHDWQTRRPLVRQQGSLAPVRSQPCCDPHTLPSADHAVVRVAPGDGQVKPVVVQEQRIPIGILFAKPAREHLE